MSGTDVEIIVPVRNDPAETRECLAALVEHSGDARFILMDLGGYPETEQVLHEFAEFLDDRALFLRSQPATGFIAMVNQGLARATAPLVIIVRTASRVGRGWLDPFREALLRSDAGILVPRLVPFDAHSSSSGSVKGVAREAAHGSLSAVGITARLYGAVGSFDEALDGGVWCMKDYSRRADLAGFRTLRLQGPPISSREEILYGSPGRRERMLAESIHTYNARWGEERIFCAFFASHVGWNVLDGLFASLLTASRRGACFYLFARGSVYRRIRSAALHLLHDNIVVKRLPPLFSSRASRSAFERLRGMHGNICVLGGIKGLLDFEGEGEVSFADFEKSLSTGRFE